jgi:uncharacterized membrane protein
MNPVRKPRPTKGSAGRRSFYARRVINSQKQRLTYMNQYTMLLVLFGVTWLLLWICFSIIMSRIRGHESWSEGAPKSSVDILNHRYAKGEINEIELQEKRRNLL